MDETTTNNNSKQSKNKDSNSNSATSSSDFMKDLMASNSSSSWTILPADRIEVLESTSTTAVAAGLETGAEKGEPEESSSEPANERCPPVAENDAQAEDFSDGISIISDCESTGRLTPSPTLRALLNDLNSNFELGNDHLLPPSTPSSHQQLRMRRQQDGHSDAIDGVHLQKNPATVAELNTQQPSTTLMGYRLPALVQNGLTAVFYVCCTLAVLSFVGRLRNPEWQMLGDDKQLTQLEQRLVELELQNNLMRAEIDIMSKQLNYLSGQTQPSSSSSTGSSYQGRKLKTFKAWPGNGNSADPVDITKQDLKRPYKCPDGKFVEIAGMCVESKPHTESLTDEIGNVVNDVLQQSQAFQHFEKLTEKLGTLAGAGDNNDEQTQPSESATPQTFHAHGEQPNAFNPNRGKQQRYQGKQPQGEKCKEHHSNEQQQRYESKHRATRSKSNEHDSDENSKERNHNSKEHNRYKSNEDDSNEHSKEHNTRYKSNEKDSNERSRYRSNEHDSKERHHKKYADKSKERYAKKQQQQHDDSGSGEWHERMMQQREHARQRQEQKRNNNWYIERGGSREQRRSDENRR
ncbi:peptidyl-prolyl cis-trans isomerase 1-like isoform X2 [Drosophila nasuta]|uniref:peptidyl-prolyl cis-trans isomerase 1-like isoform X2 n=1 Tax=Drosophila nasuta TaxID=42062 RepID=UPI00295E9520|nr:peptidyl-prolyl cis-trans isomerase 1-like isoform X2 [Drosophila nasuta]XP_060663226.1 peptidyl-prolyl cis-trans isomerase 1-like isoform X2 [Drosophila nasuta]